MLPCIDNWWYSLFVVNLIIICMDHLALKLTVNEGWSSWVVKGENYVGNIIDLPLGRFPNRHIHQSHFHQILVTLHYDDLVSRMNIFLAAIVISNTVCSYAKITIL